MSSNFIHYLITDPQYYTSNPKTFYTQISKALQSHHVTHACFRDKNSSNYKELAQVFIQACKDNGLEKFLFNEQLELAIELQAYGVHLTSTQFDLIAKAKEHNLYTVVSCHSEDEIQRAKERGADAVTFSPIFYTPNKGEPKGVEVLETLCKKFELPIIALGGITSKEDIEAIKATTTSGFASIRYFCEV